MIGLPGVFLGFLVAAILNAAFRYTFYSLVLNFASFYLTRIAIIIGVSFGITVPIIANVLPIRKALEVNLRNSLDLNHRHIGEITIVISKLKEMGLSLPQLVAGITLTVFGVGFYYGGITTYLYMNFELFFLLLNALMLSMIIGIIYLF